jgi:hypothetical protein
MTHEEMLEEAARREAIVAKVSDEDYQKIVDEARRREAHNASPLIRDPDEFVLEDIRMVHYEVMEEGRAVWMGLYLNDGTIYHLNIGGDNLRTYYSNEGNHDAP